jgi:hypothetical protein
MAETEVTAAANAQNKVCASWQRGIVSVDGTYSSCVGRRDDDDSVPVDITEADLDRLFGNDDVNSDFDGFEQKKINILG